MLKSGFRCGARRFFDDKNYPYGFRKSGHFTIRESELLQEYGYAMAGLAAGTLEPESAPEAHFIQVSRGQTAATSELERIWVKYLSQSTFTRRFYTLGSRCRAASFIANSRADDNDSADDDYDDVAVAQAAVS